MGLLARRSHFRRELAAKLDARGYPEAEVGAALDRLTAHGYLDDRRTARELVASRLARGVAGRRRLRADLERHGAPAEAIEEALAALVPEDDLPAARAAAARWRRGARPASGAAALARHLDRKGFSRRAIVTVLEEAGDAAAAGEEP